MRKKQEPVDRFPMEDIENHKIVRILKTKGILAILFVRRTGMTKPPVQLGVGKNTLV